MGLFDFFDSRIGVARWAVKWFREARRRYPAVSDEQVIELALQVRYCAYRLKPEQQVILREKRHMATDIYGLCHLIAEIELLSHLDDVDREWLQMSGEPIVAHTYSVIDRELKRLGY
jgi:hypothetical protein